MHICIGERGIRGFDGTPGMPGENSRPAPKGEKGKVRKIRATRRYCILYRSRKKKPFSFNNKCIGTYYTFLMIERIPKSCNLRPCVI